MNDDDVMHFGFHLNIFQQEEKKKMKEKKRKWREWKKRQKRKNYFQVYCTFKFVDILTLTYMHIYKAYMPKLKVLFFCVCYVVNIYVVYICCVVFLYVFCFFTLLLFLLYDEHTQITQS